MFGLGSEKESVGPQEEDPGWATQDGLKRLGDSDVRRFAIIQKIGDRSCKERECSVLAYP